jgi:urease accessory protein
MVIIPAIAMLMTLGTRPADAGEAPDGERATLFRLMTWLSPSFPVGSFSYSSGLEWAVEAGDIVDGATLVGWLSAMLSDGSGFCDGVFMAQAHRRTAAGDLAGLAEVAELAAAMVPSRERQLESTAQGRAFVDIALAAWNCEGLADAMAAIGAAPAYPVAVGVTCARHGLALPLSVHAFLHALTANWISAAARLVPLGQTASQRALAALEPVVAATGARAAQASLDDLGGATLRADLASMRHEAQYTRLFRS